MFNFLLLRRRCKIQHCSFGCYGTSALRSKLEIVKFGHEARGKRGWGHEFFNRILSVSFKHGGEPNFCDVCLGISWQRLVQTLQPWWIHYPFTMLLSCPPYIPLILQHSYSWAKPLVAQEAEDTPNAWEHCRRNASVADMNIRINPNIIITSLHPCQ